jgi:ABC-type multidrug transport system ATPase subunit
MTISLSDTGKRFNREWIFRHFNYRFESGHAYAITGPNGSGKSTLLQAVSGATLINEGTITYENNGAVIADEKIFREVSLCAPYLELIEEMTATEFLEFHQGFKSFLPGLDIPLMLQLVELEKAAHKQIRYYSSGMKQRTKLAQCLLSDSAIVLLDEPCTNLDKEGINLYHRLVEQYCKDRVVIVSSNDPVEYSFCTSTVLITDYKKK